MKKIFCKKTLSAFLAAVMVLAMIPVGMISAVAEAAENTDYVLGTDSITINTVEGWKYVSANAAVYAGYNVILGSDLDFAGATEYGSLFGATEFNGTFDGNGKTISNFSGAVAALIANVAKSTAGNDLVEVKNLKLKNISLTAYYTDSASKNVAGTIFANVIGDHAIKINTVDMENVKIIVDAVNISIGGVIGSMSCNGGVQISKVNFNGELRNTQESGGAMATGGIVGESRFAVSDSAATSVISKCHVNAVIVNRSQSGRAAGIAGFWGRGTDGNYSTDILIEDCYLQGMYSVYKGSERGRTGAVIGECRLASSGSVTINNVVSDAVLDQYSAIGGTVAPDNTKCTSAGYWVSYSLANISYKVTNCATTVTADKPAIHSQDSIGTIKGLTSAQIAELVAFDGNGYIAGVMGSIGDAKYAQTTGNAGLAAGDTYIIRFVAPILKSIDENSATMTIVVKSGDTVVKTFTKSACTMYTELAGHKNGITETYTAGEGQYADVVAFAAVAIMDVPVGAEYSYEVSLDFSIDGVQINGATFGATASSVGVLS